MSLLQRHMIEAWGQRAEGIAARLRHAQVALALFKPEALDDDVNNLRHAMAAVQWWSS